VEVVLGVAGSRKTQYAVDTAIPALLLGGARNVLFLVKVSEANPIPL
jgi:hypothetical protein